jgi:hypothetical protein
MGMSEVVKLLLAVALGLALGRLSEWMNVPWWVVAPIILACFIYGGYQTFRKADKPVNNRAQAQRQGGPFG